MSSTFPDRDIRQRGLAPPERLSKIHVMVVGVGAVGRQAALQLAALGVPQMSLFDDDRVSEENLGPQSYHPADLGKLKVEATAALCRQINPEILLEEQPQRFLRQTRLPEGNEAGLVVMCCVDSMNARRTLWECCRGRVALFVDARMSGEVVRVLAQDSRSDPALYQKSLFGDQQGFSGPCTARSTIYSASIAGGLMVSQLARLLRNLPVIPDQVLNLLAGELTVLDVAC